MRLIVHTGLHKTGSTYLQHIMNDNHEALLEAGIYYEKQPGYPAHHFAAWDLLRGDASRFAAMVDEAYRRGCHTLIFSSEDLEGLIFARPTADLLTETALRHGAGSIEWHMCVRDPGEYFASLYAQLQYHVYADAVALLCDVMRDGMVMIIDPLQGEGTPFWCYCFDHYRYISAFAQTQPHPLFVHDFKNADPFPGWGIAEAAGALDVIRTLPGADARNMRLRGDAVVSGYRSQVERLLGSSPHAARLLPLVEDHIRRSLSSIDEYAHAVSDQFAASTALAIDAFRYPGASVGSALRRRSA